jgi:CubicO group peptidase (beta-lactamase class C family)
VRDQPASRIDGVAVLAPIAARLEKLVTDHVRASGVPASSVSVVIDDRVAWSMDTGLADVEAGRPAESGTLYRIASVTKTVTAAAIVHLRDEGRLRLDQPLVELLPEFGAATNPFGRLEDVTLRHMLLHVSGLPSEDPWDDPRAWTPLLPRETLGRLGRVRLALPPGTRHKYSNLAYSLLGLVVERVAGDSYEGYLRSAFFGPLGMADTTLDPAGERATMTAIGYRPRQGGGSFERAVTRTAGESVGAGGLWSTTADLARWIAAQFAADDAWRPGTPTVLAAASLAEMHEPTVLVDPEDWTEAQGLGWSIQRREDELLVGHGGLINGFKSAIRFVGPDRVGIVALHNGSAPNSSGLPWAILSTVLPVVRAAREALPAASPPPPPGWMRLVGRYVDPEFADALRIEIRGDRLVSVDEPDGHPEPLLATDDPLVFVATRGMGAGEPYRFLEDATGAVDGLNIFGYPMVRVGRDGDGPTT